MTMRTWLYASLVDPNLTALRGLVGNRVFPKKSMKSSREEHPYIVYKLGHAAAEGISEIGDPQRQYFQIYVHDYQDVETGDYVQIDRVIEEVKAALKDAQDKDSGVLRVIYLETSQDLDDATLNTVFKYIRFQAVIGKAVDNNG